MTSARRGWTPAGLVLAALLAVGLGGCDDGTSPAEELLGLWGGVQYTYVADADPNQIVDLIDDLGATYSIHLITDGTYQWQLSGLDGTRSGAGTFDVQGNDLTLTPDGGSPTVYRYTFDQIFLTLVDPNAMYDFDGDGTDEPAELTILLDRF